MFFLITKIVKDESNAAVVSAINKVFPDSVITACNMHLSQCLGRQLHNIGLTVENKENECPKHLQNVCCFGIPTYHSSRRRFANDHSNVRQNEKLIFFLDYHVQKLTENQNVPLDMWNIIKHQHRNNNAGEGWNSKTKQLYRKGAAQSFLAGVEIERER